MDLLVAILIIVVAWVVFKSLLAVLLALLICAVALYLVRGSRL